MIRVRQQIRLVNGQLQSGRLSCPATGTHPGLICPLRQASLSPRDGRAKVLQPPPEPPKICRQTAITIAPDTGARYRQDLPYGSPAWHKTYATLRNTIEGLNGLIKDPAHEALAQPARRRVRGIAAQSIFTALLLTAANIRKIRASLAGPHRPRQDPHHPAGTAAAGQPARLPPRRLTGTSSPRHLDHRQPGGSAAPQAGQQPGSRPAGAPRPGHTAASAGVRARRHTKNKVTATVLSV